MPILKLAIPNCNRTNVYRALVQVLQTNATLKSVVKTWRTWTGDPNDTLAPDNKQTPWIRITPVGQPASPETEVHTTSPFVLRLDVVVNGTNMDDLLNLNEAIERAIFDDQTSLLAKLNAACDTTKSGSVIQVLLKAPAIGTGQDVSGSQMLVATFEIVVKMLVRTRT